MKNQEIKFKNKSEKYSIFIGENSINLLPNKIKTLCNWLGVNQKLIQN